jgi:sugar phosphate isomerase/epimerase
MSQLDAAYPMSCPEGQYRGIGYTIRAIQFAKAVDCPCVDTTDGARKPAGYTDDEVMALMKQYYRVVLEWAERYEIIINVEPHGPYTTNPDTMERILSFFDSPYLRVNLDTGNTFIAGQDPVKFLKRFRHKLSHCHIKDVSEAWRGGARPGDRHRLVRRGHRRGRERRKHRGLHRSAEKDPLGWGPVHRVRGSPRQDRAEYRVAAEGNHALTGTTL